MRSSFECELPRGVSAPGMARGLVADWFATVIGAGTVEKAKLLVSELVTNAVLHGRGRITLRVDLFDDRLVVEVTDEGPGFQLDVAERDFERVGVGGWGLSVVDAESRRWGVDGDTSRVWFELRLPGPSPFPGEAAPSR